MLLRYDDGAEARVAAFSGGGHQRPGLLLDGLDIDWEEQKLIEDEAHSIRNELIWELRALATMSFGKPPNFTNFAVSAPGEFRTPPSSNTAHNPHS